MNYHYSLRNCRAALQYLTSNNDYKYRVLKGFSEMWPTKVTDTSPEIYKRYRELNAAYEKISDRMKINGDGELMSAEDTQEIEKLVEQLTSVYCDWIGYNTRMIEDKKKPPGTK